MTRGRCVQRHLPGRRPTARPTYDAIPIVHMYNFVGEPDDFIYFVRISISYQAQPC